MLVKCICTNCAGHLEFEEESAGQKIKCPHCGFDTVLFLPGAEKAEAEVASLTRKLEIQRRLLLLGVFVLAAGGGFWAVYQWIVPLFASWLPETESKVLPILLGVALCFATPMLLCWLVFPLVWFLQARRLISLLNDIADELRSQPRPVLPAVVERSDLAVTEDPKKM